MKAIKYSNVILHLAHHRAKMISIIREKSITEPPITRINYFELLAGASENAKISVRKSLQEFPVVEFDKKAVEIGSILAMQYRVGAKNSKDFLITCIAIACNLPLLTENDKDFHYKNIKLLPYRISKM